MMNRFATSAVVNAELASMVASDLLPVAVDPQRRASMRARVLAGCASAPPMQVIRAEEGAWHPLLPGVQIKLLHVDPAAASQTALWRLAAGGRLPPHTHRLAEECLVVEGSVAHAGVDYRQGDYLIAAPGSPHGEFESIDGALLLIRGEIYPAIARAVAGMALPR